MRDANFLTTEGPTDQENNSKSATSFTETSTMTNDKFTRGNKSLDQLLKSHENEEAVTTSNNKLSATVSETTSSSQIIESKQTRSQQLSAESIGSTKNLLNGENKLLPSTAKKVNKPRKPHRIVPLESANNLPKASTDEKTQKNSSQDSHVKAIYKNQEFKINTTLLKKNSYKSIHFDDSEKISLLNETTRKVHSECCIIEGMHVSSLITMLYYSNYSNI
jgi:hypothetical protein